MKSSILYGSNTVIRIFLAISAASCIFLACPTSNGGDDQTEAERLAAFAAQHAIVNKTTGSVTGVDGDAVTAALAALDAAFPNSASPEVAAWKTKLAGFPAIIDEINARAGAISAFKTALTAAANEAAITTALAGFLEAEAPRPSGNGLLNKERYLALADIAYSGGKTTDTADTVTGAFTGITQGAATVAALEGALPKLTPNTNIPLAVDAAHIQTYYAALLDVGIPGTAYSGIEITAAQSGSSWTVTLAKDGFKAGSASLTLSAITALGGDFWFGAADQALFKNKTTLTQADVDILMQLKPNNLKLGQDAITVKGNVIISQELLKGSNDQTVTIPAGRSIILEEGSDIRFLGGDGAGGHSVLFSGAGEYTNTGNNDINIYRYTDAEKQHFALKIPKQDADSTGLRLPAGGGVYFREIDIENTINAFKFALKGPGTVSVIEGDVATFRNDVIEHHPVFLSGGAEMLVGDGVNVYTTINVRSGSKVTITAEHTLYLKDAHAITLQGDTNPGKVFLAAKSGSPAAGGGGRLLFEQGSGSGLGTGGVIELPAPDNSDTTLTGGSSGNSFTVPAAATGITNLDTSAKGFKSIQAATSWEGAHGNVIIQGGASGLVTLNRDSTIAKQ